MANQIKHDEGNNRSYDFIAPLGAGIFYTQTKSNNNTGVFRFINLLRIA